MQEGAPRKTGNTEQFWKWKREAPTCPKLQSPRAHSSSGTRQTLVISHRLLPPLDLLPVHPAAAGLRHRVQVQP